MMTYRNYRVGVYSDYDEEDEGGQHIWVLNSSIVQFEKL